MLDSRILCLLGSVELWDENVSRGQTVSARIKRREDFLLRILISCSAKLQDQWRKSSSFPFLHFALFLVIFVEADSPSCSPTNFRLYHILQVPLGLMSKAVSSDGSSLAVRMRAKTPWSAPARWRRTAPTGGQLPLRDIPTKAQAHPQPPHVLYTAGTIYDVGMEQGMHELR